MSRVKAHSQNAEAIGTMSWLSLQVAGHMEDSVTKELHFSFGWKDLLHLQMSLHYNEPGPRPLGYWDMETDVQDIVAETIVTEGGFLSMLSTASSSLVSIL